MQVEVAEPGKFLETLRLHAGGTVVVLPYGLDWKPVIDSHDAFEAILQRPAAPLPIDLRVQR